MKMHDYVNEVLDIAEKHDNDRGLGAEMFINNVADVNTVGDQYKYGGADYCNYAALNPHLKELQDSKASFMETLDTNLAEIVALHSAGKRAEAVAVMYR